MTAKTGAQGRASGRTGGSAVHVLPLYQAPRRCQLLFPTIPAFLASRISGSGAKLALASAFAVRPAGYWTCAASVPRNTGIRRLPPVPTGETCPKIILLTGKVISIPCIQSPMRAKP